MRDLDAGRGTAADERGAPPRGSGRLPLSSAVRHLEDLGLLTRGGFRAARSGLAIDRIACDVEEIDGDASIYVNLYGRGPRARDKNRAAVAAGARALCCERPGWFPGPVPVLTVRRPRRVVSALAALRHGFPDRRLATVGVTGTNGKTTTTLMLARILEQAGTTHGVVGSLLRKTGSQVRPPTLTTPDPPELHGLLRDMVRAGAEVAVLEVSSHGLSLGRVADIDVRVAVITNLLVDHTDFHSTPEAYLDAKSLLFAPLRGDACALCPDDDPGAREAASASPVPVYTVGPDEHAAVRVLPDGIAIGADLAEAAGRARVRLRYRLLQDVPHQRRNAAFAAASAYRLGLPGEAIEQALSTFPGLPRRWNRLFEGAVTVIEDMMNPGSLDAAFGLLRARPAAGPLAVVASPRGSRGAVINRFCGEALARGLDGLEAAGQDRPLLWVTESRGVVGPRDRVAVAEREAFVGGLGGEATAVPGLREALAEALAALPAGGTLLLLGAQGMLDAPEVLRSLLAERGLDRGGRWRHVDALAAAAAAAGIENHEPSS